MVGGPVRICVEVFGPGRSVGDGIGIGIYRGPRPVRLGLPAGAYLRTWMPRAGPACLSPHLSRHFAEQGPVVRKPHVHVVIDDAR